MPYPAQIDRAQIVEQARILIASDGVDQLSLGRLAQSLPFTQYCLAIR